MILSRDFYVGIVEENLDPTRKGRIKVRVQTLYQSISVENIPWAYPIGGISGKEFSVPAVGKLVNILFLSDDLYSPYYSYSENYNINLQNKLTSLNDDEYTKFSALLFDDRTQIYSDDKELTLDYYMNRITIDKNSINLEIKDSKQILNLGSKGADQQAVLGTRFMEWMDKFIDEISKDVSFVDSNGGTILKPQLQNICDEYKQLRDDFISNNVMVVDNHQIGDTTRETDARQNDIDLVDNSMSPELSAKINSINRQNCSNIQATKPKTFVECNEGWSIPPMGTKKTITSLFGWRIHPIKNVWKFHSGIDIDGSTGDPIDCPSDGEVIFCGDNGEAGKTIKIKHTKSKFVTVYYHLSKFGKFKEDTKIKKGDILGYLGNTGGSKGSHLHFGVYNPSGKPVDPESYFKWEKFTSKCKDTKNSRLTGGDIGWDDASVPHGESTTTFIPCVTSISNLGDYSSSSYTDLQYTKDTKNYEFDGKYIITKEQLKSIIQNASKANIDKYLIPINVTLKQFKITSQKQIAAFVSQIAHESGALNYSEEIATGSKYEGRTDLGNTQTGDGMKYKGRGLIQITGRSNYSAMSKFFGVDFINNPAAVEKPLFAVLSAGWWWYTNQNKKSKNMSNDLKSSIKNLDIRSISIAVNGGTNGLSERTKYYKNALETLKNLG